MPEEKTHNYVQNVPNTIKITFKTEFQKYEAWRQTIIYLKKKNFVDFTDM